MFCASMSQWRKRAVTGHQVGAVRRQGTDRWLIAKVRGSGIISVLTTASSAGRTALLYPSRSGHDGAARDVKDHAGDPRGCVGGQEPGGGGDVGGGTEPPQRMELGPPGLLGGWNQLLVAFGQDGLR